MSPQVFCCEQGTETWARLRLGLPTASNFADVLAKGQGKTRRTYMLKLLGERFCGEPAESFQSPHMERGKAMEADAREMFAFMEDAELEQVGFIRNGNKGCSPDSLIGDAGMLEIKTALPHIQLERIFADRLPPEHVAQVQGQLWVAEREWCSFVSYWPRLPLFVKKVYRDEEYIATLAAEVGRFNDELDTLTEKIKQTGAQVWEAPREVALAP